MSENTGRDLSGKPNKIEIRDVSFDYVDRNSRYSVLDHVSLTIREGEFICILGSSGCGKSTLLGLLNGLNRAKSGSILLDGEEIKGPGPDRAVVFQQYSLFPWLTVKGNILFGIKQSGKKYTKAEREKLAEDYIKKVGLIGAANKYPGQLSGGMKQRVALLRAMACDPKVLLMDEPLGAVDFQMRQLLQMQLEQMLMQKKTTALMVTHDVDEAVYLSDRVIVMSRDYGRILTDLRIDLPRPRDRTHVMYHNYVDHLTNVLKSALNGDVKNDEDKDLLEFIQKSELEKNRLHNALFGDADKK